MHSTILNVLVIIAVICLSLVMCIVLLYNLDDEQISTYSALVCLACCACMFFARHHAVAILRAVKNYREARNESEAVPIKIGISMGEVVYTTDFDTYHPQIDGSSNYEDFSTDPERLVVSEHDDLASIEINDSDIYINSYEEDAEAAVEVYSSHSSFEFQGEFEIERQSKKQTEKLEVRLR